MNFWPFNIPAKRRAAKQAERDRIAKEKLNNRPETVGRVSSAFTCSVGHNNVAFGSAAYFAALERQSDGPQKHTKLVPASYNPRADYAIGTYPLSNTTGMSSLFIGDGPIHSEIHKSSFDTDTRSTSSESSSSSYDSGSSCDSSSSSSSD
jgi:hypothetical protein